MKLIILSSLLIFLSNFLLSQTVSVETTSGITSAVSKKNIYIFEDIPYAQPPIGILRWKAPREIKSSNLITPKDDNFCIQRPSNLGGAEGDTTFVGTEDCLYLDIFTPDGDFDKKLPVMFWIHGGGNTSGLKDLYDFSKMVKKHDVIVVRVNYRLGPFGWFTHPAIQSQQQGDDRSSNFGTLDLIMALKWIKKNISNFGGDSDNVTIFGESAGGHNVFSLLASKKASGLFNKAISKNINSSNILNYWEGPEGGLHDFKFPKFLLEIKTYSKRKNKIKINNLDQLNYKFFSNLYLGCAEIEQNLSGKTLASASSSENKDFKGNKIDQATEVGSSIAKKANEAGIASVVFDRNGYLYHGRVKSLAESARKEGLEF